MTNVESEMLRVVNSSNIIQNQNIIPPAELTQMNHTHYLDCD